MQSSDQSPLSSLASTLPPALIVSLAIPPFLASLVAGKVLAKLVEDVGVSSEELFRGDRLPILPFPDPPAAESSAADTSHEPN